VDFTQPSHTGPAGRGGYRYLLDWCMDDQPIWFRCRGGKRIMAVPYPQEVNDIPPSPPARWAHPNSPTDHRPVRRNARTVERSAAGDGRGPARLSGRPAASLKASQARAASHRGAPRGDLAHHARRHRATLCFASCGRSFRRSNAYRFVIPTGAERSEAQWRTYSVAVST